jgi:hypothetical protein
MSLRTICPLAKYCTPLSVHRESPSIRIAGNYKAGKCELFMVTTTKKLSRRKTCGHGASAFCIRFGGLLWISLSFLLSACPAFAQSLQLSLLPAAPSGQPAAMLALPAQTPDQQQPGTIAGTVVDQTGTASVGAQVSLTHDDRSPAQETFTDNNGQFTFSNILPGPFHLTIASEGFESQTASGILHSGENYTVPRVTLAVASVVTQVHVTPEQTKEIAEVEIKEEEKQRVLGFVPNFYVTYLPNPAPLDTKQKFELAWRTNIDPITFGLVGAAAGIQQESDELNGYGQGAEGYAKRYAASYGDTFIGTFIGSAILPSILKQDPRYFYKGEGSFRSRFLYALAFTVICKGDNGRWQPNYSNVLGTLAAGGISNAYYPPQNRGVDLTFESSLIGIGTTAAANVLQEFIVRKFTPKVPKQDPARP